MKYLVVGGAGFIGSNIVEQLIRDGHEVVVVDNFHTGSRGNLPEAFEPLIESSCEEVDIDNPIFRGLDGIFYANGASSTPMYRRDRSLVGKTINGFIRVLDLASKERCKLVYTSSSSVYNGNPTPWNEGMEVKATDFYTEAKFETERMARLYYDFYDVQSIGLRPFSVYGLKEEAKGEYANLISQFLWAAMEGKPAVIYGDGKQRRDFTYISDVVRGFILAMDSTIPIGIYNLGTGVNYDLNEMIEVIEKAIGRKVGKEYISNPLKNYVDETLADTRLAARELGFTAEYTLEEGVKKLCALTLTLIKS